ncbi:hypothetical protein [uncultured Planktosalinus sp.]|uniref:hypothetical protein n=1 Tax=uncultured Planktosalinus sp. TaxID=1810935 RepID=UPI0030D9388C
MFVIVASFLFSKQFSGIALWPFIMVKSKAEKNNKVFMNHERIHLRQQQELLILPFYFWYAVEFIVRWIQYKEIHKAYRNICFEREAYCNETDLKYLKFRKIWSCLKYV